MLKPTVMNILKMGENYLNEALDYFKDDLVTVALIDMRLNQIASDRDAQLERAKNSEIRKMVEYAKIQEELIVLFEAFGGSRRILLINALEPDYVNDYEICEETFTVTSKVARENQNDTHECTSLKEAQSRVITLAYDRVYHKYVDGNIESLNYVKQKLVA